MTSLNVFRGERIVGEPELVAVALSQRFTGWN